MHLLASVNAGFAAASLGHVELYVRGTNTRATWYGDFEASTSNSSGANITLDAQGSALIYVNQLVDVVVKDVDGVLVREYGDGYASGNVEVISAAFTGTDYVTAASAVSKPTTLQAVADRWLTNAGAPDWKVLLNGTATTMLNAFGALNGLLFNVKSPAYGAVGDGVTNDQAAIQAALAAAVAAGGGIVFFPKGTYRVTTALAWDPRVSMVGVGIGESIITIDSSATNTIQFSSVNSTGLPTLIYGMTLQASQANSGSVISLDAASDLAVINCFIGASTNSTGIQIDVNAASNLFIYATRFNLNSGANPVIDIDATLTGTSSGRYDFDRLLIVLTATTYNGTWLNLAGGYSRSVTRCTFDASAETVGTYKAIQLTENYFWSSQCRFISGLNGFTTGYSFTKSAFLVAQVYDNAFQGIFSSRYTVNTTLTGDSRLELKASARSSGSGAAYTSDADSNVWELSSSGVAPAITMPNGYFAGQIKYHLLNNTNAGAWAPVGYLGSVSKATALPATTVPAAATMASTWIWSDTAASGTYLWMKIAEV